MPHGEVVVDLAAFQTNLRLMQKIVAPATIMAVLKSDAYGHGLLRLARAAIDAHITFLGALDIPTALALRRARLGDEIDIFAWLHTPGDDYRTAIDSRIDLGISNVAELNAILAVNSTSPARLHLKIDTGLHRNGASEEDWPQLVRAAVHAQDGGRARIVGVWTHIAEASEQEDTHAIARFEAAIALAEGLGAHFTVRHLAASAASFARADSRFDLVRVGAFAYGISPGGGVTPHQLGLHPVMTLRSAVTEVAVGSMTRTALVPLGTGDGIPREVVNTVRVALGGELLLITDIGLDWFTVDLGDHDVAVGETVVLFGDGSSGELTLQAWADALGTIGEEIAVRLSPRLQRIYTF
ncbi:MAG: alr [Homoserinimonas sp.]|nr:alr [Homoserinimonas sp.]